MYIVVLSQPLMMAVKLHCVAESCYFRKAGHVFTAGLKTLQEQSNEESHLLSTCVCMSLCQEIDVSVAGPIVIQG